MNEIISKTITIISKEMPPDVLFIEKEIKKQGIEPIRWAIVEVVGSKLILNVSGVENI